MKTKRKVVATYDLLKLPENPTSFDYDDHYDQFKSDFMDALLNMKCKVWVAVGKNLTWDGRSGVLCTKEMNKIISACCIGNDFTCTVYKGEERNTLDIVTTHHDCPTGSFITVYSEYKAIKLELWKKQQL